jgi:hypothetical protein
MRSNDMIIFQLHAEHGVWQGVDYLTFHFYLFFFCHLVLGYINESAAFCPKQSQVTSRDGSSRSQIG